MKKRNIVLTFNFTLVVVLALTVAKFAFWSDFPQSTQAQNHASDGQSPTPQSARPSPPPQVNYNDLLNRNLFTTGGPSAKGQTAPSDPCLLPSSSADWQITLILRGTIAGPPTVARALIENPATGQTDHYKIGDVIDGIKLIAIKDKAVVLSRSGRKKVLRITTAPSSLEKTSPRKESSTNAPASVAVPRKKSSSRAQMRNEILEDFLAHARIETYMVNNEPQGLLIRDLEKVKAKDFLGLKNGDVVRTVNGQSLTSKQKAFQVFKKARTQPNLEIEYLRDNKSKTLTFSLN